MNGKIHRLIFSKKLNSEKNRKSYHWSRNAPFTHQVLPWLSVHVQSVVRNLGVLEKHISKVNESCCYSVASGAATLFTLDALYFKNWF